jgi:hypothetical protein
MPKIISVTTVDDKGHTQTWEGDGRVMVVKTKAPIEDVVPALWPDINYVYVHMVPTPGVEVKTSRIRNWAAKKWQGDVAKPPERYL